MNSQNLTYLFGWTVMVRGGIGVRVGIRVSLGGCGWSNLGLGWGTGLGLGLLYMYII